MKMKIKKTINLNNRIKDELPFSSNEILDIFKIVDTILSDEDKEKEVWTSLCSWHEPISLEQMEQLHKKINIFLQQKS